MYGYLWRELELGKIDTLTKTKRAGQIDVFLEQRHREARSSGEKFSVLLVDIDGFKAVNDTYTHEIGNHTLSELADVIRPRSKGEEIFRYGGDEFLIITKLGVNERKCYGYADRIVREVTDYPFLGEVNSEDRIYLTVSCGCAVSKGQEEDVSVLRRKVVYALKKAKEIKAEKTRGKPPDEEKQAYRGIAYLYSKAVDGPMGQTSENQQTDIP